jgi:DNA ligase-1
MSEKLDGIRAYWDGVTLLSKQGNRITAPTYFTKGLPNIPLDGELWLGRGTFDKLQVAVKSNKQEDWMDIKYMIFDLPGSKEPLEVRRNWLRQLSFPSHIHIVDVEQCKGSKHLEKFLDSILECGGEGVMINEPKTLYCPGISSTILKVKVMLMTLNVINII